MSRKNWTSLKFLERTNQLSSRLGISLRSLAPEMGLSVASLFGYRNGSIPISPKAWKKLEQAERAAGLGIESMLPTIQDTRDERLLEQLSSPGLVQEPGDPSQKMIRLYAALEAVLEGMRRQMDEISAQMGLTIPMEDFISMMKAAGAWPPKKQDSKLSFGELIRKYSGNTRGSGD